MSLLEPFRDEVSDTTDPSENTEENTEENTSTDNETNGATEPTWWMDSDTPGVGDRPEFLPEKFKSVADMGKSYSELEKRLGNAPKEYDFSKGESWADPEHEAFKELADFAKTKNVPQEVMDKVMTSVGAYFDGFKPNMDNEREKLGENANEKLETLNNWAKANLSEDAYYALTGSLKTAEAVQAMEEVRQLMLDNNTTIPGSGDASTTTTLTREEVDSELQLNFQKYKEDPTYRAEIKAKFAKVATSSNYSEKLGA